MRTKKALRVKHASLTASYFLIFIVGFCFVALCRNLTPYMNQYLHASLGNIRGERWLLGLVIGWTLLGQVLVNDCSDTKLLQTGILMSVLALLLSAVTLNVWTFMLSTVFISGGLALSVSALWRVSRVVVTPLKKSVTGFYVAMVLLVACSDGLLAVVSSYYGFKQLCCGLAMLLLASLLIFRFVTPPAFLGRRDFTALHAGQA